MSLKVNILLLGNENVGKTTLVNRYLNKSYEEKAPTIGFELKHTKSPDKTIRVGLFDPSGLEKFRAIIRTLYKRIDGIILLYDPCNAKTFLDIQNYWLSEVSKNCEEGIPKILVSTKSDSEVQREVTREEGEELAAKLGVKFFEVSSKENKGIEECLRTIIEEAADSKKDSNEQNIELNNASNGNEWACNC